MFWLLLSIGLAVTCFGVEQGPALATPAEELTYRGKSLGEWTIRAKDRNPQVRIEAASALGAIGPAAKPAIPVLTELLKDEDGEVRRAAAKALEKIKKK